MSHPDASTGDAPYAWLYRLVHDLEHVLPGQASIKDFVHHNTLHGFQHLPFREALAAAEEALGVHGYLPAEVFRGFFRQGRIDLADLDAALDETPDLDANGMLPGGISRREVLLTALRVDLSSPPHAILNWRIEACGVLARLAEGVSDAARERLLAGHDEREALGALWLACQRAVGAAHGEAGEDPVPVSPRAPSAEFVRALKDHAAATLPVLIDQPGQTLRGLLMKLTGRDLMDALRPYLVRHLSAYLDQGMAAWHHPGQTRGFYAAWLDSARADPHFDLLELDGWEAMRERLPARAEACIEQELQVLGVPREHWAAYLEGLAKELPGWSGMFLWRQLHPGYQGLGAPVNMADYLAVRLVLERVYGQKLASLHFKTEASRPGLRGYLRHHPAELRVRLALYNEVLPEWLEEQGHRLVREAVNRSDEEDETDWLPVAMLAGVQPLPAPSATAAWPLFLLCQHLGIPAEKLAQLGADAAGAWLDCLRDLTPQDAGWVWLQAYERHYREQFFTALAANRGRGPWVKREHQPAAQLVFCMDDREEGLRRHLEELQPSIETLGTAAHFNVPHAYCGLDQAQAVALAPVVPSVVIPAHEVREAPRGDETALGQRHARRRETRLKWKAALVQGTRLGLMGPAVKTAAAAPATLVTLVGKAFAPARFGRLVETLRARFDLPVHTRINFTAANDSPAATPDARRLGFTDLEMADRVQTLLKSTGLTYGFARLVVIAGHGSHSQNNPHASAYNCGACAGNFSGPNARLVSAMANQPAVRASLRERGIAIPDDTWFIGAEHDTCDDVLTWFDTDLVPPSHRAELARLGQVVDKACRLHAQERCRRFMSAPATISPEAAWRHVTGRANDYSQARPELGHATNASAVIGRRAVSRGAFLDRRAFLISYDPTQDPDGAIVERHLLTNGVVGAGISLEYYFSTANNERYGCGTKVMHNVTGLLGVMEGAASDLRTGLPRQMIEVHEAMRLLAVVEQKTEVLTAVYQRQPPLQELVGNGWVQLAAIDPDTAEIHRFVPGTGWVKWQPGDIDLPSVARSQEWTRGQREALPPALIRAGSREVA
jgi:uncharacterized protein YbcC (UPF0753/DUF2309 family)